jgi:hypothetical protein
MHVIAVLATISCARAFVVRGSALNTAAARQISSSSVKMVGSVTPQVSTSIRAELNLLITTSAAQQST